MRVPPELEPLLDMGVIDGVLRPLMSGKEAQVYLVTADGDVRVAKVYKDAGRRSFKHRSDYLEGRRGRNTRAERAKGKRSAYGRAEIEAAWRSAEVDAINRLYRAGVRVPEPYDFVEGVLVMQLVRGDDGEPAPRLVDVDLERDEARDIFFELLSQVTRMLCVGLVHGDLSDFNVLLGVDGPTIIDLPQAIDAAANPNARRILVRDVDNLTSFFSRWVPKLRNRPYGAELWDLYERAELTPETRLTGRVRRSKRKADVSSVVDEIAAAVKEEGRRRAAMGLPPVRRRSTALPEPPAPRESRPSRRSRKKVERPAEPTADPFGDLDALLIEED
ncbi:MAG: PA4780 family RIO1-like protein kinase [Myxococcota bacterium]